MDDLDKVCGKCNWWEHMEYADDRNAGECKYKPLPVWVCNRDHKLGNTAFCYYGDLRAKTCPCFRPQGHTSIFPKYGHLPSVAPTHYACSRCGASGVRLYRQYSTFANHLELECFYCTLHSQKWRPDGMLAERLTSGRIYNVGGMVAAIPDAFPVGPEWEIDRRASWWGYSSIPQEGCAWWEALPLHEEEEQDRTSMLCAQDEQTRGNK